jgi:predicted phosphodiesterase
VITFFEYADQLVNAGHARATLCYILGDLNKPRRFDELSRAERVYSVEGNKLVEIKNRYSAPCTMYISDEDLTVLKLKAVPLPPKS